MRIFTTAKQASIAATLLACTVTGTMQAQVSAYTFTQQTGTFQPLNGSGTMIGYALVDDEVFVIEGDLLGFGLQNSGNGWPIGFPFHFNGIAFDRVGLSTEGWLSFGRSSYGAQAVYLPIGGPDAYTPVGGGIPEQVDPSMRNRIVAFANDLRARQGIWPLQIATVGIAPNRTCIIEWNVSSTSSANGSFAFQVRLQEGGGDPAQQTVKVVYGAMSASSAYTGQVGLGGSEPTDFNNRSVTVAPYDWAASTAGADNAATCRIPSSNAQLPAGLTYTWTPPACAVAGVEVSGLAVAGVTASGTLTWHAVTGASSYDYVITAGGPTDPPVASGTAIAGTSASITGLPLNMDLFAYVRATCAPTAGWSTPHAFTTVGLIAVVCGEAPVQTTYCYDHYDQRSWLYTSTDGSPLRLTFHAGDLSVGDRLVCYDGADDQAPVLYSLTASGSVAGQVMNSLGDRILVTLIADGVGSCSDLEWVAPLEWEVGCVDCEPVLANYQVVEDCENGQFSVNVTIFSMGSASAVQITNDGGAPAVPASAIGQYVSGPFPIGTPVIVTAEHSENAYCSSISTAQINDPCPIVSCGPDEYTYCYTDGDVTQRVYRAEGSGRIGIRFLSGSLADGDAMRVYDGEDIFGTVLHVSTGVDLTGTIVTSSPTSNTILLEVASNGANSCATGAAAEWNYVIECFDGCEAPVATYSVIDDCANAQFSVVVALTSLGTASSVAIANDGGAPAVTATAVGNYTVGPFAISAPVTVAITGTSALCSTNSPQLSGCSVGMEELSERDLMIFPNPASAAFQVMLPSGFGGRVTVEVLDLAGRRVAADVLAVHGGLSAPVDLGHLPAGSYVVVVDQRFKGRLQLVR